MGRARRSDLMDGAVVLRAARKAASFRSASAAAAQHGFPDATYRAQEAGRRPIQPDDAVKYAAAFAVDADDLLHPSRQTIARMSAEGRRQDELAAEQALEGRWRVAGRLKVAREASGYDTASEACRKFGFPKPTYLGHEAGKSSLSAVLTRVYAAAFSVNEQWLANGQLPTGLGKQFDERLASIMRLGNAAPFRDLVQRRPVDMARIKRLRQAAPANKETSSADGDVLREIRLSTLADNGVEACSSDAAEHWVAPKGFARHSLRSRRDDVLLVVNDLAGRQKRWGDRFFLDMSQTDIARSGEFLVLERKRINSIRIFRGPHPKGLPPNAIVIGKIVGKLLLQP